MKPLLFIVPFTLFLSCSNDATQQKTYFPASQSSQNSDCLLQYATQYDRLFTLEDAAGIIGRVASEAEVKNKNTGKNTRYHEVVYVWKTDRVIHMHGMDVPDNDRISLTGIGKNNIKDFKRDYSRRTEEEIVALNEQINQQLDKQFDEKSDNEKIEASKKKMNELGTSNEAGKTTAKKIGSKLTSSLDAYEEITGLGDAASWNTKDKKLYVLSNGVEFCVRINLGEEDLFNRNTAVEAAKLILNKCK